MNAILRCIVDDLKCLVHWYKHTCMYWPLAVGCDKAHSEAVGPDGLTTKTNRLINAIKFATREKYLSREDAMETIDKLSGWKKLPGHTIILVDHYSWILDDRQLLSKTLDRITREEVTREDILEEPYASDTLTWPIQYVAVWEYRTEVTLPYRASLTTVTIRTCIQLRILYECQLACISYVDYWLCREASKVFTDCQGAQAVSDGVSWRCPTYKTTKSIRDGSFISKSKLTLQKWMVAMLWWSREYPVH